MPNRRLLLEDLPLSFPRTMPQDVFRPTQQPAQSIYDAFQAEATHRRHRGIDEWMLAERTAVWRAARDAAQQLGWRVLTMEEVRRVENQAAGHTDYGAKWAYGVVEAMRRPAPAAQPTA